MAPASFPRAFVAGMIMWGALAAATAVAFGAARLHSEFGPGESAFSFYGGVLSLFLSLSMAGGPVQSALAGLVAGRAAGSLKDAAAAGALAGLTGSLGLAIVSYLGIALVFEEADAAWETFAHVLWVLPVAVTSCCIAAVAMAYAHTSRAGASQGYAAYVAGTPAAFTPATPAAPPTAPPPAAPARRLQCPRCSALVEMRPGQKPVCGSCGYSA